MDSVQITLQNTKKQGGFLKFVLPSVLSMVFMSLYTIVDGIFVARYSGPDALAAINIVMPLFSLSGGVGIMAAGGGSALVGIRLGAGEKEEANRIFSMIVSFVGAFAIAITILSLLFFQPLLRTLGASDRIMPYAVIFGKMIVLMMPVFIMKILLEFFMRIDGKPNLSLIMSVTGGVINIVLDYLFMAVFHMGIRGAAIATATGAIVSFLIGVIYFLTKSNLKFTFVRWQFRTIADVCINGSSEMLTEVSIGVTTFLFNISAMKMAGEEGLAALSVVMYVQFLLMSVFLGFSTGVAPLISYAYGAKAKTQMKQIVKRSLFYTGGASIVVALIALFQSELLAGAFLSKDSSVFEMTSLAIRFFSPAVLIMGFNIFVSARYTALGQGLRSAIVAVQRTLIGTVIGLLILPKLIGIDGLWMVIPFAEIYTLLVAGLIVFLERKSAKAVNA